MKRRTNNIWASNLNNEYHSDEHNMGINYICGGNRQFTTYFAFSLSLSVCLNDFYEVS